MLSIRKLTFVAFAFGLLAISIALVAGVYSIHQGRNLVVQQQQLVGSHIAGRLDAHLQRTTAFIESLEIPSDINALSDSISEHLLHHQLDHWVGIAVLDAGGLVATAGTTAIAKSSMSRDR